MAIKIKQLLESTPKNGILLGAWMSRRGLSRTEQVSYVKSGWLERISLGVYALAGNDIKIYPALVSLNEQSDYAYHIGAFTALDIKGYSHFGQLGRQKIFVYSIKQIPKWLLSCEPDADVVAQKDGKYEDIGITNVEYDGSGIIISSPERAFFECLDLIPHEANPMDLYYIMEMLTSLRPRIIMQLLDKATIRTRRLFLYMAQKAGHPWFDELDLSAINLGKGDRSITPGGVYDSEYKIVIPKDLAQYE